MGQCTMLSPMPGPHLSFRPLVLWIAAGAALLAAVSSPAAAGDAYQEAIRRAATALDAGDASSGLSLLDQALRENPEGAEAFLLLGRAYESLGRHEEAATAFQRGADLLGPDSARGLDALYAMAGSLAELERNVEAVAALQRVLAAQPNRPSIHRDLGMIHLAVGRLQAAAEEFRLEIASSGPQGSASAGVPSEVLGSSYEGLGIASYRLGDDRDAIEALRRAPDTVEARYHLGLALARSGRQEEAAETLRQVLAKDPDHRGALQALARAAAALGREEERSQALARFQDLYRLEEESQALRVRIRDLRKDAERKALAGDMAGAAAALGQAATLDHRETEVLLDLARWQYRAKDPAGSEASLRKLLSMQPLQPEAHFTLGRIQADRGDLPAALRSLEQACRLAPTSASYHIHLAQVYLRANRTEDGVRELSLARRLNPSDPTSSFNLGLGLAQAGRLQEAARELEAAVALGFKEPVIHQVLSQVYAGLGDTERSARERETFERLSRAGGRP